MTNTLFPKDYPTFNYAVRRNHPTYEQMKKFVPFFSHYENLFPHEVLVKALESITLEDITSTKIVSEDNVNWFIKQKYSVKSFVPIKAPFKKEKNGWYREVYKNSYEFLISSPYIQIGKYTKACLKQIFPWFSEFSWSCYNLNTDNDYIYLNINSETIANCVYVPIRSMLQHDVPAIIKTHTDYHTQYYSWPGGWGKSISEEQVLQWRKNNLDLLESDIFKRFCRLLRNEPVDEKPILFDRNFKLPVTWGQFGYVTIKAKTLQEAVDKFNESCDEIKLPYPSEYVDGSFELSSTDVDYLKTIQEN